MSNELSQVGQPRPGQEFERLSKIVRDTYLVNVSTELTPQRLFSNTSGKDAKYRTANFPSNSQAYQILGMRITPHILFALTKTESQTAKLATFAELSRLSFTMEGNIVFDEYISQFLNFDLIPSAPVAADKSYLKLREKFTNFYKFPTPITVAANTTFDVEFKPVAGLTTAAASTSNVADMYLPDSGLTGGLGYAIYFDFITANVKKRG